MKGSASAPSAPGSQHGYRSGQVFSCSPFSASILSKPRLVKHTAGPICGSFSSASRPNHRQPRPESGSIDTHAAVVRFFVACHPTVLERVGNIPTMPFGPNLHVITFMTTSDS